MAVEIRPYAPGDIAVMAGQLREHDAAEVWLSHGVSGYDALLYSVGVSRRCFAATVGGYRLALFGVAPADRDTGSVWLLGSDAINLCPRAFARASKRFLPELVAGFRRVENHVWAEYKQAIRWLEWLGFTLDPPLPWGVSGALFRRAWLEV